MGIKIGKPLRNYTVDMWGDWTEKESYKSLFRGYAKPRWGKGGPSLRAEHAIWIIMKVSKYRNDALRRRIHYIARIDREEYSVDRWKVDSTIDFIQLDGWTVDWIEWSHGLFTATFLVMIGKAYDKFCVA